MITRIDLADWTLRPVSDQPSAGMPDLPAQIAASVPGCVHTDLLAAGLIPDPYVDRNEELVAWIGYTDWEYATTFSHSLGTDADDHLDLVCEGLDTVATIFVNDVQVLQTENMHRSYRISLRDLLVPGVNNLRIRFDSAIRYVERHEAEHGYLPQGYAHPYNFIRKMGSNFGWDWGPTLVTAGIWKPIRLEQWSRGTIAELAARTSVDVPSKQGTVHVEVGLAGPAGEDLTVSATLDDHRATALIKIGETATAFTFEVDEVELWWPRTHGDQPLYLLKVELTAGDDQLDRAERRVGFKKVAVDTSEDEYGRAFTFMINDQPVFVRGANWIPNDCFVSSLDAATYQRRIDQACVAGMNLLRVWGGGIYESEDFYAACDERGLLVWQDFLFACAGYPETEPFASEVVAEATENVRRIAAHPSLALWNGSNENVWGWYDWGWPKQAEGRAWGERYYREVLPAIVAEHDPGRPYVPSSPWSTTEGVHPNHAGDGPMHQWDVWNRDDYLRYRDEVPRFAAEYGFQSPPTWSTLARAVPFEERDPHSATMEAHQKQGGGQARLTDRMLEHFPPQKSFDDWHLATMINQADALRCAVEHLRSWSPRSAGSIIWQLNDCWPVASWAMIDSDGKLKPSWYAVQKAYADRLLTWQPRDQGWTAILINDSDEPWTTTLRIGIRSIADGSELHISEVPITVAARGRHAQLVPANAAPLHRKLELLVASADDLRATHAFVPDLHIGLPPAERKVEISATGEGYQVRVTAVSYLADLVLQADRLDAEAAVDSALISLFPGESHTFEVTCSPIDNPDLLAGADILRTRNDLHAR